MRVFELYIVNFIDEYNKNYTEETAIAEERQSKKNEKEAALSLLNLNNIGNVSNKNKTGHSTAKHKEIRNRIIRKLPVSEQDMINSLNNDEIDRNKRARSAKLRVYKKVSDNPSRILANIEFPEVELGI